MRWRIGNHYGIHVYEGDRPDSRPVATFHREEDARRCVDALTERDELAAKVASVRRLADGLADVADKRVNTVANMIRAAIGDPQ